MSQARFTRSRTRFVCVGFLLASLTLMLAGCFGPPKPQFASVSGSVSAPPSLAPAGQVVSSSVDHTPVSGASVAAFDFADGKQVGTTAITDANGRYTISNVPKGIDVVVIAVKDVTLLNGSRTRLSALIADVAGSADGDIDGVTSLVSEAWGRFYRQARNVAVADLRTTHYAAMRFLERVGWLDLTQDGTLLYRDYGNGLKDTDDVAEVIGSVPDENDSRVWPAKEMIQDLRDAGLTIQGTFEHEIADPAGHLETEVAPYLMAVATHVGELHPDILDCSPGEYSENADGSFTRVCFYYTEQKWLLHRFGGEYDETWTREGMAPLSVGVPTGWTLRQMGPGWIEIAFEVERIGDDSFVFEGMLSVDMGAPGAGLPTAAYIDAILQDADDPWLAEETTLTGEYNGTFDVEQDTVEISVDGHFVSAHVNADGELAIAGDLAAGGSVTFSGSIRTAEVTLSGGMELSAVLNETVEDFPYVPDDVRINGSFARVGVSKPIFDGATHITFTNADTFDFDPNLEPLVRPGNWPSGTVEFIGSVNPPGKAGVSASIMVSTQAYMEFDATVRYDHGSRWLEGNASYSQPVEGRHEGELHMRNQAGLKVDIGMLYLDDDFEATGTIKNSSNVVIGTIVTDSLDGMVRVVYEDGSWESLF